jgi:hypothetical protein
MASKLYDLKLIGFTAAGTVGTGPTGQLGTKAIELWDDGSIQFTNAAGVKKVIANNPELNILLKQVLVGTGGVPSTKLWQEG